MGTKAKWTFGIADWICQTAPHPEDGEGRELKVWFCIATNEDGERLRSRSQWEDFDKAQWVADKNNAFTWAVHDGNVGAVPIPPSVWLFGSGLIGLVGIARRKAA